MNGLEKYAIIKNLVDNNGNKNTAAIKLNLSRRQINRLIIIYMEKDKSGFVHGNRGHIPTKALLKLALSVALPIISNTIGVVISATIASITITTNSSINVKPFILLFIFTSFFYFLFKLSIISIIMSIY